MKSFLSLIFLSLYFSSFSQFLSCDSVDYQNQPGRSVIKYHYVSNAATACGTHPMAGDSLYCAINQTDYINYALCGSCLSVKGPLGEVVVRVSDMSGIHGMDISPKAFSKINDTSLGSFEGSWKRIACPFALNIVLWFDTGSNSFYKKIKLFYQRNALYSLEMWSSKSNSYISLLHTQDDFYVIGADIDTSSAGAVMNFRATDIYGQQLIFPGVLFYPGTQTPTFQQFPFCNSLSIALAASDEGVLTLFPNPANQEISILSKGGEILQLLFLDIYGRIKYVVSRPFDIITIPPELPSGVYMVIGYTRQQVYRKKLVLKHTN